MDRQNGHTNNIKYNEPIGTLLEDQQSETFIESKIKCKQVAYEVYYTKNQNLGLSFYEKLYLVLVGGIEPPTKTL